MYSGGSPSPLFFFSCWTIYHQVFNSPDIHWDKSERSAQPFDRVKQASDGQEWVDTLKSKSRWNRPGVDVGAVSVFEAWLKPMPVDGLAKVHGPTPPPQRV